MSELMPFAKLDSGIVKSSIWNEPLATRILWITMLAIKDENGMVESSGMALCRIANISKEEFDVAIKCLESPDPDSKTKDFEGKRISKIDGGWLILNNDKYKLHSDIQREQTRERVKRHRDKIKNVTQCNVTGALRSISTSKSISVSNSCIKKEMKIENIIPPSLEDVSCYCKLRNNGIDAQKFIDYYDSNGWVVGKVKMKNWQAAIRTWEKNINVGTNSNRPINSNRNAERTPRGATARPGEFPEGELTLDGV